MGQPFCQCLVCGAGDPIPVRTAVGERLYCTQCFHGWRPSIPAFNYSAATMCSKGTADTRQQSQLSFIAPFVPRDASILEIGCASGEFAAAMQSTLSIGRYEGIELSPVGEQARLHLDRLHAVRLGELILSGELQDRFDLVVMSHVLEHIEDVHGEIELLLQVLKPGGTLFIEVPNRGGHPNLPLDDNISHLHFFSPNSLSRLLSIHGFEIQATESGARLDARYADSLRVAAKLFFPPSVDRLLLTNDPVIAGEHDLVVWGAGNVALEILANYLDPTCIDFFIDGNPAKQGTTCMGRPVARPEDLGPTPRTILIASVDFADEISDMIRRRYPDAGHKLITIGALFDGGLDGKRR